MLVILAHLAPVLLGCAGGYAVVELCPDCEDTAVEPLDGEYLLDLSINEVMASNSLSWVDDDESSPDWIELYNGSELEIDLDGFLLRDELEGGEPSEPLRSRDPIAASEWLCQAGSPSLGWRLRGRRRRRRRTSS